LITPANLSGAVNQFAAKTATFLEVSSWIADEVSTPCDSWLRRSGLYGARSMHRWLLAAGVKKMM
jgi:hypothetical protein